MKSLTLVLFFLLMASHFAWSQREVAKISLSSSQIFKGTSGIILGDSILVTVKDYSTSKTYLISPNGTVQEMSSPQFSKLTLCAVIQNPDQFYFYDQRGKKVFLTCYEYKSGEKTLIPKNEPLEIAGRILGSYVQSGSLFLIMVERTKNTLKIIQVDKGAVAGEQVFSLIGDLLKNRELYSCYFDDNTVPDFRRTLVPIKIFKQPDNIFITIDESYERQSQEVQDSNDPEFYKTTVMRLDLRTGTTTTRMYMESSRKNFHTYVTGNYIFREIEDSVLSILDFESSKVIKKVNGNDYFKSNQFFVRDHSNQQIHYGTKEPDSPWWDHSTAESRESEIILTLYRLPASSRTFFLAPTFLSPGMYAVAAITTFVANKAIADSKQENGEINYVYLKGNPDTGFTPLTTGNFIRQKIDLFEIRKQEEGKKYEFKGYLKSGDRYCAFYKEKNIDNLSIVLFE